MIATNCHAEVLRSIWPDRANKPDASEYLSMTALGYRSLLFRFALALCLLCGLCSSPALALEPDQIALLVNKNVPEGRKLAEFYAQQRHIPDGRIIEIDLPAPDPANFPELITPGMYDARVVPVVREFLTKGGLDRKIICLVSFW